MTIPRKTQMLSPKTILDMRTKRLALVEEAIDSELQSHFGNNGCTNKATFSLEKYKLSDNEISGLMNKYVAGGWKVNYEHGSDQRDGPWQYLDFYLWNGKNN
jgi:hypothetical protein